MVPRARIAVRQLVYKYQSFAVSQDLEYLEQQTHTLFISTTEPHNYSHILCPRIFSDRKSSFRWTPIRYPRFGYCKSTTGIQIPPTTLYPVCYRSRASHSPNPSPTKSTVSPRHGSPPPALSVRAATPPTSSGVSTGTPLSPSSCCCSRAPPPPPHTTSFTAIWTDPLSGASSSSAGHSGSDQASVSSRKSC